MASSTIPACKSALLTQLQNRAALKKVTVSGKLVPKPSAEWIWIKGARGSQHAAALGNQSREERYSIEILVSVVRAGQDVQKAGERAFALVAEIENQLRSDAKVNGTVRTAEVEDEFIYEEFQDARQSEGRITLHVFCTARI